MANYNCTQLGCVQDPTGIYPDLLSCQAACIGWGCPPQLTTNTDIVFIYDSSGSYNPSSGMKDIFTAATAWTATLAQAGWTGTQRHSLSVDSYPTAGYGKINQELSGIYLDGTDTTSSVMLQGVSSESWLAWGAVPYYLDSKYKTPGVGDFDSGINNWGISEAELSQYWVDWKAKPTVKLHPSGGANTGGTFPANDVLVVSFCHESSEYDEATLTPTFQYKNHYAAWDVIWSKRNASFTPKGFLATLFTGAVNQSVGPGKVMYTAAMGIQCLLNGNQDDVANGGTGTLDGTWISIPAGGAVPNSLSVSNPGYCDNTMPDDPAYKNINFYGCSTVPGGMGTANPCVVSTTPPIIGCPASAYYTPSISQGGAVDWTVNNFWVAGQPTWGGLGDKGWGAFTNEIPTIDSAVLSTYLNDFIGTIATPATVCISAETLYTANVDYPYQDLSSCNNVCFPLLDPWYCDGLGTPCYQDPQGTFTFGVGGTYATSQDAYTACTAQCNTISGWSCNQYGCFQETGDTQFDSLSACTAQCTSYSCTTEGCYGPFQGTGATGTYSELSACTATCYHYECVTDSYATQVLPNIYYSGSNTINGCVQLSGSVGTSPNALGFNEYSTLSSCTASCISWQCCEDLAITPNSVMYVYYDITSMNSIQTQNAIQGIVDWTENHPEFTGHTYHMLWWSERWLTYPNVHYTLDVYRFTDNSPSSYWNPATNQIQYANGSQYATNAYNHQSNYWNGNNSPRNVLGSLYQSAVIPTTFIGMTDSTFYSGNATHSIHDSFAPGVTLPGVVDVGSTPPGAAILTKGYDGIQTASTTDDVITIVFQDETYSMYHNIDKNTWGSEPTNTYKLDHAIYMSNHNSVTGTTASGGTGGNLRSFLYPTQGANYGAGGAFALHAVAAIHSGDISPRNGLWSATTYPKNNSFTPLPHTHEQCEYNLDLLSNINSGGTANPYWDSNGDGTFAPTWGALDQYGWRINFRFDTYEQSVFESDLTAFLTATTISCDTICNSGHTAQNAEWPYSSLTQCEGLVSLGECTGCTRFNCGPNGCYTATTGQYSCLSDCTAS